MNLIEKVCNIVFKIEQLDKSGLIIVKFHCLLKEKY